MTSRSRSDRVDFVDVRHHLDERGDLAPVPVPAVSLALFFGSIVSWTSGWPGPRGERTNLAPRPPGSMATTGARG